MHIGEFCLSLCVTGHGADVAGTGREIQGKHDRYLSLCMYYTYDHVSSKAPYEKKAEAAKKKYAEEMAAYEAK